MSNTIINTIILIDNILSIYYIRHSYMFWSLMLAIFSLYKNIYQLVIQTIYWLFLGVGSVMQLQDLIFVKEGHVVWVTIGDHAII